MSMKNDEKIGVICVRDSVRAEAKVVSAKLKMSIKDFTEEALLEKIKKTGGK
jgi:hypothetical protein